MKTVDLSKENLSLMELLSLAKRGAILIHSPSGDDFLLEEADDFDREVAALGGSDKFMAFLDERSRESKEIPLSEAARRRASEDS
jgi:hypothetical protein